jgi:tetratricopeptide (TPR) repeat protein
VSSLPQTGQHSPARKLYIEGVDRLQYGDLEGARRLLKEALALDPAPAEAHYQLANCCRRLRLNDEAETAFKAALERDPNLLPAWFSLTFLYAENGRRQDAAENLTKLVSYFSGNLEVQHKAGGLMGELGLYREAAAVYERILELQPQARNHLRLGQYYQKMGRYEDTTRHLIAAIDQNPDAGAAYLLLANNQRFGDSSADQALLKRFDAALLDPSASPTTRVCLEFALGKMRDDMDDYDRAFEHFARGNELRNKDTNFVAADWLDTARQIEAVSARDITPAAKPGTGKTPVFVVGMLRSGTTLLERTLASHPQVVGLGEASWLQETVGRAVTDTGLPFPACLFKIQDDAIAKLREEYLRHWTKDATQAVYMVDKNPINFVYLGLVARVFPEAKVVHCHRDPRDAGLSIYFQNFANQDNTYAYDLASIAHFHNGYARIMRHWEKVLPAGMLYRVDYEAMVSEQEKQTRGLLEFLGLPWDDACLTFHTQTNGIATASVWQARQPLYTRSVGRWRRYERHLGPLLQNLALS